MIQKNIRMLGGLSVVALGSLPSLVSAGSPSVSVIVGAPSAAATAVPTLSSGLTVALGLVLMVVALRFLSQRKAYQKILSVAVLAGGVIVTAVGVDRVQATLPQPVVTFDSPACSGSNATIFSGFTTTNPAVVLTNNCQEASVEIKQWLTNCGQSETEVIQTPVGTVLAPAGTAQFAYCSGAQE